MNVIKVLLSILAAVFLASTPAAFAADAQLDKDAQSALKKLYAKVPAAKTLGQKAVAVLVFPRVTKAGLGIGGQYGEGAMIDNGKVVGYYSTAGASYGLQAGAQRFGYAMFFMNEKALQALTKNEGMEVGVGPSVVVMDESKMALAKQSTSTTLTEDVYAFIFSQKGLMAGLGIQGNKITKLNK